MKNKAQKGVVNFLILKQGEGEYLGICKEFGFVEEGPTPEIVIKRMTNAAKLLIETVQQNPRLEPSLNVKPPFRYLALFYITPFISTFASLFSTFKGDYRLVTVRPLAANV